MRYKICHNHLTNTPAAAPTEGVEKSLLSDDTVCSRCPARKSRNICEPRFEVKDFFEFLVRLSLNSRIFARQSKNGRYLSFPTFQLEADQFLPEQGAHFFVQLFVGQEDR